MYEDLGYWAISGSIRQKGNPRSWGINASVCRVPGVQRLPPVGRASFRENSRKSRSSVEDMTTFSYVILLSHFSLLSSAVFSSLLASWVQCGIAKLNHHATRSRRAEPRVRERCGHYARPAERQCQKSTPLQVTVTLWWLRRV